MFSLSLKIHQAEFNHTVLHGQRFSNDLGHIVPPPLPRPLVVPKPNIMHPPPPVSSRPSSAVASRPKPHEPVKAFPTPSPAARPASAVPRTPSSGASRCVKQRVFGSFERCNY